MKEMLIAATAATLTYVIAATDPTTEMTVMQVATSILILVWLIVRYHNQSFTKKYK